MKRYLSAFLALLILLSATACSSGTSGGSTGGDTNVTESVTEAVTEADARSVLAAMETKDYDGYTFNIWAQNWVNSTLFTRQYPDGEMDGEPVNDALYKRDALINEKYNVEIKYTDPGMWPNDLVDAAKKSVMSGEDEADLIIGDLINVTSMMITNKYAVDLNTMPELDMSQPWWNKFAKRDLEIAGKMYFAISDITTRNIQAAGVVLFNKSLFADCGLSLPYDTVRAGNWTFDEYNKCLSVGSRDLNGNGEWDSDADQFCSSSDTAGLYFAAGKKYIELKDGMPEFVCGGADSVDVIDRLTTMYSRDDMFPSTGSYSENDAIIGDRMLMYDMTVCNLSLFTDMKTDFGIVPLPKYDEKQESYYNCPNPWMASSATVPITAGDLSRTGTLLEAISAVSHYTSIPASYDVTIELKQTRDEDSIEMLRIAGETTVFDLGVIFSWGNITDSLNTAVSTGSSFVTLYEKQAKQAQKMMEKTLKAMGVMDDEG